MTENCGVITAVAERERVLLVASIAAAVARAFRTAAIIRFAGAAQQLLFVRSIHELTSEPKSDKSSHCSKL